MSLQILFHKKEFNKILVPNKLEFLQTGFKAVQLDNDILPHAIGPAFAKHLTIILRLKLQIFLTSKTNPKKSSSLSCEVITFVRIIVRNVENIAFLKFQL